MAKLISILGSTGSIGLSSLKIIDKKKKYFNINIFSANKNYKLICMQIKKYKPKIFIITDPIIFEKVKIKFKRKNIKILNKFNQLKKKSDITISAIPGIAGLLPTVLMIKLSRKMLIANKESIICGWNIIKSNAIKYKTKIVPVDSEHFSISKLLENYKLHEIKKIYLTASGGPFFNFKKSQLKNVKPKDALKHPRWKMGKKITIDSSSLMNKMLEYIEAQKLFNLSKKKLDIIIHPESLVHAIVKLKNGLSIFIYHETSMIVPLTNAIFDGQFNIEDFYKNTKIKSKDIDDLTFFKPDKNIFPIIKIKDKVNEFPSTSIIINASNEILVDHFLKKKIPFMGISKIIMIILNDDNYKNYAIKKPVKINQIYEIDLWAKNLTLKIINQIYE